MILDTLNDEQRNVVESSGNVLLTACPGSGKTRVIINKIAHELSRLDSNSKQKILALTFTNRASDEITKRLSRLGALSPEIWSGTIHSFCMEWIIKPYSCYIDELKNGYSVADETFISNTITELKEEFELGTFHTLNMKINRDGSYSATDATDRDLLDSYYNKLKEAKLIDFELLLSYSYKLLEDFPRIAETLASIFKYILVDEFQDTQDIQYAIISQIIRNGNSKVMFVGDTDQAIYTSLGGVAKNFEELKEEIADDAMIEMTLSGNYRSRQRIIDFYKNFQTNNIEIESQLGFDNNEAIISFDTESHRENLPEEIARLIQLSLDSDVPESEICVLVPQWWLITSITRNLRHLLPNVNFDASGLTPMSKIRENIWYKLGRLFLSEPNPKIYSARYKWATEILDGFKLHIQFDLINELNQEKSLLKLVNSIDSTEEEGIDYLRDCFKKLMVELNFNYLEHESLVESWDSFFSSIQERLDDEQYDVPSDTGSFKNFYKEMKGIVIQTCVGVKGEEFETVIAYGLLHGYIPHWNDIIPPEKDHVTASKKLLYVICSRAKRNLHLIAETGRATRAGNPLDINHQLASIVFDYNDI